MSATTPTTPTLVTVYRSGVEWCYAAWLAGGDYDSSDSIGIDDDATAAVAMATVRERS